MSQEIVSVSRATATTALRSLVSDLRTLANGAAIDRTNAAVADLKHGLDAPVPPAGEELEESFERRLACLGSIDRCDITCGLYGDKFQRWGDAGPYVEHDDHVRHIEFYAFEVECLNTKVTRLQAENAALQQRLNVADQRVDELERKAKLYDQLQRGAELLPEGWMIKVEIERDGGGVTLIDPQGNDLDYPSNRESMGDEVEDAIEEALGQQAAL